VRRCEVTSRASFAGVPYQQNVATRQRFRVEAKVIPKAMSRGRRRLLLGLALRAEAILSALVPPRPDPRYHSSKRGRELLRQLHWRR
jgi:hypothetical protein